MKLEKVILTGSTGFIGANILRKFLESEKFEMHIFLRKESKLWRIEELLNDKHLKIHYVDIMDLKSLKKTIEEIQPQYILHLATYGAYPTKQTDEDKIIDTNFKGTVNLMRACQNIDYKCFINTGSSSEYGKKIEPMSEDDVLEPTDTYGITKAASQMYGYMLAKRFEKNIVHIRLFSTYGYYEEGIRLVPVLAKAIIHKEKSIDMTSGKQTRDFIFVEDIVDAYLHIMEQGALLKGETINIGTGNTYSIRQLAETMKKVSGSNINLRFGAIKDRPNETYIWCSNPKKMKKMLDWKPKHTLEEGLLKTMKWFEENIELYTKNE